MTIQKTKSGCPVISDTPLSVSARPKLDLKLPEALDNNLVAHVAIPIDYRWMAEPLDVGMLSLVTSTLGNAGLSGVKRVSDTAKSEIAENTWDIDDDLRELADIEFFKEKLAKQLERGLLEASKKTQRQLELLEDSAVIYKEKRLPEKRIFYIDVGVMPKGPTEKYLKHVMEMYETPRKATDIAIEVTHSAEEMLDWSWNPVAGTNKGKLE